MPLPSASEIELALTNFYEDAINGSKLYRDPPGPVTLRGGEVVDNLQYRLDQITSSGAHLPIVPEAYGAIGDGVANDGPALKAFFAALPGRTGRLVPGKTYRVASASDMPFNVPGGNFDLDMTGAVIDASGIGQVSDVRKLITVAGDAEAPVSISSAVTAGRISFATLTPHGLAAGDTVLLSSDDLQGPEYNALETRGQFATVALVLDSQSFMITEAVYDDLTTAPKVVKCNMVGGTRFHGGKLIGPGRHATYNGDIAIDILFTTGAVVEDVEVVNFDYQAISIDQSRDYRVSTSRIFFQPRWVTSYFNTAASGTSTTIRLEAGSGEAGQATGYFIGWTVEIVSGPGQGQRRSVISYATSTDTITVQDAWDIPPDATSSYMLYDTRLDTIQYGVAIKNASDGGLVEKIVVYGGKHGIDFTRNSNPGVSRLTTVTHNVIYGTWDAAIATHGKSTHAKICYNWCVECLYGVAVRTPYNEVFANHFIRCGEGARLTDNPAFSKIHGNFDEDCIYGVRLPSTDMAVGGPDRVRSVEVTDNTSVRAAQNAIEIAPALIVREGYATAAGSTTQITIQAPGSAFDAANVFNGALITIIDKDGVAEETRTVSSWNYATSTITLAPALSFSVALGDEYRLVLSAFSGTVTSASATTAVITNPGIDPNADGVDAADDYLAGMIIEIVSGTGAGQSREILDWVQSTNTITVAAWDVVPDNTSVYRVFDQHEGLVIRGNASSDCAGPDIEVWGRWLDVAIHNNHATSKYDVATAHIYVNGDNVQYPSRVLLSGNTAKGKLDPLITDFAKGVMIDGGCKSRADLVNLVAVGHVFTVGVTYHVAGLPYYYDGSSTWVSDLPGFTVPSGALLTPEHAGAVGDGVADDTAAIISVVAQALVASHPILFTGVYLTSASIPSLHDVVKQGPGALSNGSRTFPVAPARTQSNPRPIAPDEGDVTNTIYVNASTGSDSNDGLSTTRALATLGEAFNVLAAYGPTLSGLWKIALAAGTYTAGASAGHKFMSHSPIFIEGTTTGGVAFAEPTVIIDGVNRTQNGIAFNYYQSAYLKDLKTTRCANGVIATRHCSIYLDNVCSEDDAIGRTFLSFVYHGGQGSYIRGATEMGVQELFNCTSSYVDDASHYLVIDGEGVSHTGWQRKECCSGHLDYVEIMGCTQVELELQSMATANVGTMRLGGGAGASPVGILVANSEIHDYDQVTFNAVNPASTPIKIAGTGTVTDQYGWTGDASALTVGIPAPVLLKSELTNQTITSGAGSDQDLITVTLRQGYLQMPNYAFRCVATGVITDNGSGGATTGTLQFRPNLASNTPFSMTIPAGYLGKNFRFEMTITTRASGSQDYYAEIRVDGASPIVASGNISNADTGTTPFILRGRRSDGSDVFTIHNVQVFG